MPTTFKLLHLRPATISRTAAAASNSRKAASAASASCQPIRPENVIANRPASQAANSIASGPPWIGRRPVQFGIAVRRNPAITAPT